MLTSIVCRPAAEVLQPNRCLAHLRQPLHSAWTQHCHVCACPGILLQ